MADLFTPDQQVQPAADLPANPPTVENKQQPETTATAAPTLPVSLGGSSLPDLDKNHYERIKQAQEYHSPVEEEIRQFEQRAAAVKEKAAQSAAQQAQPEGGGNGGQHAKPSEGAAQAKSAPVLEQIVENGQTYTVERRQDGYYVTQSKDDKGNLRTFDGGIFVGTEAPKGGETSFFDTLKAGMEGTGQAVKGLAVGADMGLMRLATNAVRTLVDNPVGKWAIGEQNVEAYNTFANWLSKELDKAGEKIFEGSKAGSVGQFVGEAGTNFIAPAVGAYGKLKALGANPLVAAALADVGVALFGVNPDDPNLANLLPDDERLKPFKDIMATDPADPSWKNRARNATEALVTLGLAEAGSKTIVKAIGEANKFIKENNIPQQFMDALDGFIHSDAAKVGAAGAGGAAVMQPQDAEASLSSKTLQKAIKMLGPVEHGATAVADDVVRQMEAAAKKGDFVGFGNEALKGIDFNLSRMQSGEEIGDLINKVSEVYAAQTKSAKRGVQTFDQTQIKADLTREMGFDIEAILARQKGEAWNAEKLKAARDIFHSQAEKTKLLAQAIKEPGGNSQEALIAFRRELAVLSAVQMQIKGAQTEAARALSQFRMTAKSPLEASVNVRDMLDHAGGHDANENLVDAFLNIAQNGPPDGVARFAREAQGVTSSDMLYEAWINSLLGSPVTHEVNIVGNALAAGQGIVERYGAAGYGAAERTVLRMMGKTPTQGGVYMKEANAYARGMAMSVWDALQAAGRAMKSGEGSDIFGKLEYGPAITSQNVNQLPIAKSIAGKLGKSELLDTNSTMALFVDRLGEFYYRLPGRFLMAEDEFFKTLTYRAELHAQTAREAMSFDLDAAAAAKRRADILADPQVAAPEIHIASMDNAREFTFTAPAGDFARNFQQTLRAGKLGDIPVGRVVIPFFNVINNITKFAASRTPGFALLNPNSKTYKDLFSGDPARRQMVMGKWATGGAIAGSAAWLNQNGVMTGRLTDDPKLRKQMQAQGKSPYSVRVQMPDGSYKMAQYNRLEPIGMVMGIAATTSEVMNYVDNDEERENIVIAATAAILPYLEDKSFFKGAADFTKALFPQFGDDEGRVKAISKYFTGLLASAPGAVGGPLAPGTPLSRVTRKAAGDNTLRETNPDPYRIEKDDAGDDILVPNDTFAYRTWEGAIKKIMDATPGLSSKLPPRVNLWGEPIVLENGLFTGSPLEPIASSTVKYDVGKLQKSNLPQTIKNGYFNGAMIGRDITPKQFEEFVNITGIDGELERLGVPLSMPNKEISARNGQKIIGLPVKMNDEQYFRYMTVLNTIKAPNDADGERRSMTLKEALDWLVKQPEYAKLPEAGEAKGAKADVLRMVVKKYRAYADNLILEEYPLLFNRSVQLQMEAQQTGAQ